MNEPAATAAALYTTWRIAHDRLAWDDTDEAHTAERNADDALIDYLEVNDLNHSEWDIRDPENVHRSWIIA